jgi:hypothetical protein
MKSTLSGDSNLPPWGVRIEGPSVHACDERSPNPSAASASRLGIRSGWPRWRQSGPHAALNCRMPAEIHAEMRGVRDELGAVADARQRYPRRARSYDVVELERTHEGVADVVGG